MVTGVFAMVNLSSGIYSYAGMGISYSRIVLMLDKNKPSGKPLGLLSMQMNNQNNSYYYSTLTTLTTLGFQYEFKDEIETPTELWQ